MRVNSVQKGHFQVQISYFKNEDKGKTVLLKMIFNLDDSKKFIFRPMASHLASF